MHDRIMYAVAACLVVGAAAVLAGHLDPISVGLGGLMLGAVVQSTYSERIPQAVAGMIADMSSWDADSRTVENSNGVGFGLAVGRGTADGGCRLGAAAVTDFLGIAVRDVTLAPQSADSDYVDEYQQHALAAVLTRGVIWVAVEHAVADGNDVTFNSTTGALSTAGTSGTQFLVTGARWMDTQATVGGLARVRLSGHLPAV